MKPTHSDSQKGNATLVALLMVVVVAMASSAFYSRMQAHSTSNGGLFARKRTFYASESTRYIVSKLTQNYLSTVATPDTAELQAYLIQELPKYIPANFTISHIEAGIVSATQMAPIATGTFKGMSAPQTVVRVSYDMQTTMAAGMNALVDAPLVHMTVTLSLAQVGMFEFLYFIDLNFADFSPGPVTKLNGRVHSNGDLCLSGYSNLTFSNVTSAGRVMFGADARCQYKTSGDEIFIGSGPNLSSPVKLTLGNDNDCKSCGGTSMDWASYASAIWKGNLLDQAQNVTPLSLPVPPNIQTQLGSDGDDPWEGMTNDKNLRFIIDPLRTADTPEVAKQKYAYKADIRIISGVWYLRSPSNPLLWPGVPIWSDHPGHATDDFGNNIGQDDLKSSRWPSGNIPHRYSYYEYNAASHSLYNNEDGVISYGNLYRDTSGGTASWHPGHWLEGASADLICPSGNVTSATGFVDAFKPVICSSGTNPLIASSFLNATRSGIYDNHILNLFPVSNLAERPIRAKVLPTNFDMDQFQLALKDTTPGELGSYFAPGGLIGQPFNGVLFITNTWPGSGLGFTPSDAPTRVPLQISDNDSTQPLVFSNTQQRDLPQALCSEISGSPATVGAGQAFDNYSAPSTPAFKFTIPSCLAYQTGTLQAYPSSIRIINGSSLNPAQLTSGLSVISNIGVYLQGEYNTKSDTSTDVSTPWMPSLVGADQIVFLSNGWSDANSKWDGTITALNRPATPTTYNTAVISGWMRSGTSMPLHAFPTMMENWTGQAINFTGSIVIGFYPIYEREGRWWDAAGSSYKSGPRFINFDKHYNYTVNQPPGSPLFFISAVLDWKAQ